MNKFKNGDFVSATSFSTVKEGVQGVILEVFQDGQFWKYEVSWRGGMKTIAREKDLTLVE